ncbi:MAG: hypothetical protein Cons2KO_13520 [Congregibacter sp.]
MLKARLPVIIPTLYIAFVFVQSLFFKFAGAPETVHIFSTLDSWAESTFGITGLFLPPGPFNAYVIGSAELVASALLLLGLRDTLRPLNTLGAIFSLGIISGAICFHLFTPLGVDVQGDGGLLFAMAVGVWLAAAFLAVRGREYLPLLLRGRITVSPVIGGD